jgi:preprotein translocase subunit SecD
MFFNQEIQRPLNTYPKWKYLLVVVVLVFGGIYAAPNLYGEDPAIQVSPDVQHKVDQALIDQVEQALVQAGLPYKGFEVNARGQLQIRFSDTNTQLSARDIVAKTVGDGYVVALNLAPAIPDWLKAFGAKPMTLGLDLRGGIHFLLEVDMDEAIKKREEQYVSEIKETLRNEKIRYAKVDRRKDGGFVVALRSEALKDRAVALISDKFPELTIREDTQGSLFVIKARLSESKLREIRDYAVKQNITTLRNRVNQLGVAEPLIQRQGADRIVVQLPGVQDSAQAKKILGATASIEFHLVKTGYPVQNAVAGRVPPDSRLYYWKDGRPELLLKDVIVTGDQIVDASTGVDENGLPQVNIALDSKGGSRMAAVSSKNIGRPMATVFIEYKTEYEEVNGVMKPKDKPRKVEQVISVATIQSTLGSRFRITGIDSAQEAHDLALLLRAGALVAPVQIVEERTIGPSLGAENIRMGILSVQIGLAMVLLFMAVYYRVFGLIANLALLVNLVLIVAIMSMLGATLTLPGIAGIVLTVGMAVDANVLIFERIREELRVVGVQRAIHQGYDSAFSTIADANITTLVAAIILFAVGTGPIKGFAVTLSIGILTSMFTAIMGTRAVVNLLYGGRKVNKLWI